MNRQRGFTVVELVTAAVLAAGLWGWVWNIVKIVGSDFSDVTGILIARCIGVFFAPLGAVLGFL